MTSATKRGGGTASTPAPPPAKPSFSLALPTAASGPDPLAPHQGLYNGGGTSSSSAAAAAAAAESDDEWDEILAQPDRVQQTHHQEPSITITMIEDDGDDGLDFLERELLGEDEPMADGEVDGDGDGDGDEEGDEDMEEMMLSMLEEVAPTPRPGAGGAGAGPMSMNQFVGGGIAVEDEDDEYSSSEESDED